MPDSPWSGPVRVDTAFHMPIPKSMNPKPRSKVLERRRGVLPGDWHFKKPDRDNLEKFILDCLSESGMWVDDGQVCAGEPRKVYSNQPRTEIILTKL